jgi:hypothetical protein
MKLHYLLLAALFVMPSLFFAQDFKGLKSIGGEGSLSLDAYNTKFNKPLTYEINSMGLGLSTPFYGKFLTNRFYLGGEASLRLVSDKRLGRYDTIQIFQDIKGFDTDILFTPTVRYYFNENPNFRLFVESQATLGLEIDYGHYKFATSDFKSVFTTFSIDDIYLSLGFNKQSDTHIYWESKLRYQIRKNLTDLDLTLGLQNFMPNVLPKKNEETPQYLAKGKSVFDANGSLRYTDYGSNAQFFDIRLNYFQAKFVTDKIAVGGSAYVGAGSYRIDSTNQFSKADIDFSLNPVARYYIALTKRLYVYPQIGVILRLDNRSGEYYGDDRLTINYTTRVGFNYFVSKNVAYSLDFNLNRNQYVGKDVNGNNFNTDVRLGVVYFIDKVKW